MTKANLLSFCLENKYTGYVFFVLVCVAMCNQLDRYLLTVVKIPFVDYNGTGYALLVGPYFTLIFTFSGIVMGMYGEKSRVQKLGFCLLLWSMACLSNVWATAFWGVALARVFLGMGQAGCNPFAVGLIGDYFPAHVRGSAMGIYNIGVYTGYSAALSIGTWMYHHVNWQFPYYVFGFSGVGLAALLLLTVRNKTKEPVAKDGAAEPLLLEAKEGKKEDKAGSVQESQQPQPQPKNKPSGGFLLFLEVLRYWMKTPSLLLLCVAGGVRNAGGYVWGAYAPVLFSPLYEKYGDQAGDCSFSFNATLPASQHQVCTADFPYCMGGDCQKLNKSPFLNKGMSAETFESFMSWMPLVCGSIGAVLGGAVSDYAAAVAAKNSGHGPLARVLVAGVSNVLAAPICALTLFVDTPWCFLSKGLGYFVGEMWIGVTLALVVELVPSRLRVTSVALYMFIITNIGGNASVLVPSIMDYESSSSPHTFHIMAASATGAASELVEYTEVAKGSFPLQMALFWMYPFLFFAGGLLFGVTYLFLRRDLDKARALEVAEKEKEEQSKAVSAV